MSLTGPQKEYIQQVISTCLRNKFQNYKPESKYMPFHFHLLGKDRMALYSFIHSLNTSFGTSIFEPVAVALSKNRFKNAISQYVVGDTISEECQQVIQTIMNHLTMGNNPNKLEELERIRAASIGEKKNKLRTVKVDLFLERNDGQLFFFDLKTVKPNMGDFKDFKRTLLEWAGIVFTLNPNANVNTLIAIPYNPYEPNPYERWTLKGMLDLDKELKVAEEFWDFIGGVGAYTGLLDCFEKVGIEMRSEIEQYFLKFRN